MRGLKVMLRSVVPEGLLNTLRVIRAQAYRSRQRAFDRRFGVDTAGVLSARDMDVPEEKRRSGTAYMATPRATFVRMLRSVTLAHQEFTFLDIGSGKGAVLLYASDLPFRKIVGVEYSAKLNEIAQANIRRYSNPKMRCRDLTTLCVDAVDYPIPDGPLIFYLHNPFSEDVMVRVMANIESSIRKSPREVIVMSYNPVVEDILDQVDWLVRIRTGWNHAIYRNKDRAPTR